jgi:hypothetical protein
MKWVKPRLKTHAVRKANKLPEISAGSETGMIYVSVGR